MYECAAHYDGDDGALMALCMLHTMICKTLLHDMTVIDIICMTLLHAMIWQKGSNYQNFDYSKVVDLYCRRRDINHYNSHKHAEMSFRNINGSTDAAVNFILFKTLKDLVMTVQH